MRTCNKAIDDKMEDWSGNLVGKVKEELKWNDDLNKAWTDEMGSVFNAVSKPCRTLHIYGYKKYNT